MKYVFIFLLLPFIGQTQVNGVRDNTKLELLSDAVQSDNPQDSAAKEYLRPFVKSGIGIMDFEIIKQDYKKGIQIGAINFRKWGAIKYLIITFNAKNIAGDIEQTKTVRFIWGIQDYTQLFDAKDIFYDKNDIIFEMSISKIEIIDYQNNVKMFTKETDLEKCIPINHTSGEFVDERVFTK